MGPSEGLPLEDLEESILQTVLYSSLFQYPLTPAELHRSLLRQRATPKEIFNAYQKSKELRRLISFREGYFYPASREDMLEKRIWRQEKSRDYLSRYRAILKLICTIPYTRLVALSGSAAHRNMDSKADVDLFIVVQGKRVWSTALTILLLTKVMRCRETVCFNYIIADTSLTARKEDLFNANQIAHLSPIIGHKIFEKYVRHNRFVQAFYPNLTLNHQNNKNDHLQPGRGLLLAKRSMEKILFSGLSRLQEWICKQLYSPYLRRKRESWSSPGEVVLGSRIIKLHGESHRAEVMERFQDALAQAATRTKEDGEV